MQFIVLYEYIFFVSLAHGTVSDALRAIPPEERELCT